MLLGAPARHNSLDRGGAMSNILFARLLLSGLLTFGVSSIAVANESHHSDKRKCDESLLASGDCDEDDGDSGGEGNQMEFCQEFDGAAFGLCNAFCNAQQ